MSEPRSAGEIIRESIYNWLWREFEYIAKTLSAEERVNLDGVLWKLSDTLANAGMWKALQDTYGANFAEARKAARP
jgi:hypothetical protein